MKPECIANWDVRSLFLELPDTTLMAVHVDKGSPVQKIVVSYSADGGSDWQPQEELFPLDMEHGRWDLAQILVDNRGEIHIFLLNDRGTGVFVNPHDEGKEADYDIYARYLDIWHCKTENNRSHWTLPESIWRGYTGSVNSVIQTREGRIILPFAYLTSRVWSDRGEGPDAFWYAGQYNTTVVYSDDNGESWEVSPSELKVQTPSIGRYGAVEPVVLQLQDGRVWMLIRTQTGRFYESFSKDGNVWSQPKPTRLISSDSPAGIVRLPDKRIVLIWNKCLRFPYALGGRHVLHAAISEDEGKTWIGSREVARDPLRHLPPPPDGDHGTAYPYPLALKEGKVVMVTGQGKGRLSMMLIDPEWLYEKEQDSNFLNGFDDQWSVFGCKGVEIKSHPQRTGSKVLSISKIENQWPAAAVWNFPGGMKGVLEISLCLTKGFGGAHIMLSDHFSVPFDPEDELYSLFSIRIGPEGEISGKESLLIGQWYTLKFEWDCQTARNCRVYIETREVAVVPLQHNSDGACYLRLHSSADGVEEGSLLVESVSVAVE